MIDFDNPSAFAPFYDRVISYSGTRPNGRTIRGSVKACVLDAGFDDVFADGDVVASRIRKVCVIFQKRDARWLVLDPPQVGDEITLEHGVTFAVTSVGIFDRDQFSVEARQK